MKLIKLFLFFFLPLFVLSALYMLSKLSFNENSYASTIRISLNQTTIVPTEIVSKPTESIRTVMKNFDLDLKARSFVIEDLTNDLILAQKNATRPLPPASTTKVMTALLALESYDLNEIVTMPNISVDGAKLGLQADAQMSVENLLYALLLYSGNDIATALAMHHPGGSEKFVELMNEKAKELKLEQTNFMNPTGLHHPMHLSSALDLMKLTKVALQNPKFAEIVATKEKNITSFDGKTQFNVINRNELMNTVEGVKGVKTGWTEEAGESLVTLVERDSKSILITMLGSDDRFGETKKIITWSFDE